VTPAGYVGLAAGPGREAVRETAREAAAEIALRRPARPSQHDPVMVRRETAGDTDAIGAVTYAAFVRPEAPAQTPAEVGLVEALRAGDAWLPRLSLVATSAAGEVIGHVVCSRGWVGAAPALALGPLSVRPDHQRRGVGSALMHAVLAAADALDEPLVALLGDPAYYARFGFERADDQGIVSPQPEWGRHFQARALTAYAPSLRGTFAYPEPFDRV
jgi:putative acetyltransferase